MSIKQRFSRAIRANLNDLLDIVVEIEQAGGIKNFLDPLADDIDFKASLTSQSGQKTLRDYYANLEVPFGSDLETCKEAYKMLMRKYHPDRHAASPEMEELATNLSQEITRAFQSIESYLMTGRY